MEKTNNLNINLVDRIKMVATNRRLNQSGISRSKTNESIHENASQSEVESVVSSNAPQTIVTQVITTSLSADSPAVEVPEAGRSFIVSQSVGDSDHRRTAPTDATELSVRQITPLSNFLYHVNATIVGASVRGVDRLFCRYAFVSGPDWIVMGGAQSGCTSIGVRNRMQRAASILPDLMQDPCRTMNSPGTVSSEQSFCTASCVWNTVVQATYSSSNVFGWPQILLQVYTLDWMGREKIQAYGHIHLPPIAGNCTNLLHVRQKAQINFFCLQKLLRKDDISSAFDCFDPSAALCGLS